MKIAILGGGISGLSAAWRLAESRTKNIDEIVVLEKNARFGGLISTTQSNNHTWDNGAFSFHPSELTTKHLSHLFIPMYDFVQKVWIHDNILSFPFSIKELINLHSFTDNVKYAFEYLKFITRNKPKHKVKNLEDWLNSHLPSSLVKQVGLDEYVVKLMGLPPSSLSAEFGRQRLAYIEDMITPKLIARIFRNIIQKPVVKLSDMMYCIEPGVSVIPDELTKICRSLGVVLYNSCNIRQLSKSSHGNYIIDFNSDGTDRRMECDFILSTIPVEEFYNIQNIVRKSDLTRTVNELKYRDLQLVHILLDQEKLHHMYYLLYSFDSSSLWKRLFARSVKDGKTVLTVESTCDPAEPVDEDYLKNHVLDFLTDRIGLFEKSKILEVHTSRISHAYPIYSIEYDDKINQILSMFKDERIYFAGRQARFWYILSFTAMDDGFLQAENILKNFGFNHSISSI